MYRSPEACDAKRGRPKTEVMRLANYPQYNYQPQPMGYQPQMQPMYQQYQQPAPMQQQPQEQFFCRPVASADEARGIPVDFSGRPMILPQLNAGKIYVKIFDQGSGSAIFREFRMVEDPPAEAAQPAITYAPMSEVEGLRQQITELQNELKALKASRKKTQPEVVTDEV
jgi:hypothetical protein